LPDVSGPAQPQSGRTRGKTTVAFVPYSAGNVKDSGSWAGLALV